MRPLCLHSCINMHVANRKCMRLHARNVITNVFAHLLSKTIFTRMLYHDMRYTTHCMGVRQCSLYVNVITASGYASSMNRGVCFEYESGMALGTREAITLSVALGHGGGFGSHPCTQVKYDTYTYTYTYTCTCTCTCTYTYINIHICMYMYAYHIYPYIHIHIHIHCTHTHTHTPTHTQHVHLMIEEKGEALHRARLAT